MCRAPIIAVLALALAGCGSEQEKTPSACLSGAEAYTGALAAVPGPVLIDGEIAISECFVPGQEAGELAGIGIPLVEAATELNSASRAQPGSPAAHQVGFLVGAVERGASETGGIHADLVRRIEAAARYSPGGGNLPPAFERQYEKGYAAGRESG